MKKIGKIVALASLMLCGYVGVANAECVQFSFETSKGTTHSIACGDSPAEISQEMFNIELVTMFYDALHH